MTTKVNVIDETIHGHCRTRISWSAIFIGALIGVGLSFLMNLFGVTIGLSAFSMTDQGVMSLALGGLFGLIISTIIAMFFAGYASGYIGRLYVPRRNMGMIYGFTTWIVSIVMTALLTTYVGNYVDSYSATVTHSAVTVSQNQSASKASESSSSENQIQVDNITPKEASGGMAIGAFIVFALFFIGAFSSCLGARHGMSCQRND